MKQSPLLLLWLLAGMCMSGVAQPGEWACLLREDPKILNIEKIKQEMLYPKEAYDVGISGKMVYRVLFDEKGNCVKYKLIQQVHPLLRASIEPCLPELKAEIYMEGDQAKPFWINITFNMYPRK